MRRVLGGLHDPYRVSIEAGKITLEYADTIFRSGDELMQEGRGDELVRELLAHQIDLIVSNYPPVTSDLGELLGEFTVVGPFKFPMIIISTAY